MNDPPDFVRTFGMVVPIGTGALRFTGRDAIGYAHPDPPPNCARGKVVAFSPRGSWCDAICFQLSDSLARARVVGCCNGTAAAAALYAEASGCRQVAIRLRLPGRSQVRVEARVIPGDLGGRAVAQVWRGVRLGARADVRMDGRRYLVCGGPLNEYLIVQVKREESVADFPIREAVRLWEHFGLAREPLLSRIAVVQDAGAEIPRVKFFTCGEREHPSAPLTGLAVLALAARRLGWSRQAGCVETPVGPMALPRVADLSDGTAEVEFSKTIVHLDRFAPSSITSARA